jgi:hypothetical protein
MWRRKALEAVPELAKQIREEKNPFGVWIEIQMAFEREYELESPNQSLLARIYGYARWCLYQPKDDNLRTAVIVCFYEHLPQNPKVRTSMHKWLSVQDFENLRSAFRWDLTEQGVDRLGREFYSAKKAASSNLRGQAASQER